MYHRSYFMVAAMFCALTACGSDNAPAKTAASQAPAPATVSVPKSNVFNPLVQDLNKAKQVQNQLEAEKQKTDKQIQAQSASTSDDGGGDPPR